MKKYWLVKPDCYIKSTIENTIGLSVYDYWFSDRSGHYNFISNHPLGIYLTIEDDVIFGFMPYPNCSSGNSKQWLIENNYIDMGELSRKAKLEKLNKLNEEILVCEA